MKYPQYFCAHLNEAKILISEGRISEFPIRYSRSQGFSESKDPINEVSDLIISNGEINGLGFNNKKSLYSNSLFIHFDDNLESEILEGVKLFCPLVFAPLILKESPFIIAHMAQTLDGKICTNSGHSKWIGNEENLKHAHRLRAMVDGVLVGGNTIARDLPRLNVRHVKGSNPVRLLLSNTFCDFEKLPNVPGMQTYLLRRKGNPIENTCDSITKVIYYEGASEKDKLNDLLGKLKQNGIDSILLEGGSGTVSSFYKENKIDWLQLHIAPLIFGSGKSFIQLSEISDVSEGRKMNNVFYNKVGDSIMITGELN